MNCELFSAVYNEIMPYLGKEAEEIISSKQKMMLKGRNYKTGFDSSGSKKRKDLFSKSKGNTDKDNSNFYRAEKRKNLLCKSSGIQI